MRVEQLVAQRPPALALLAQQVPDGRARHGIVVVVRAGNQPAFHQLQDDFANRPEILRLHHLVQKFIRRLPILATQGGEFHGGRRMGVGQGQRGLAQGARRADEKYVGGLEVAVGVPARPLQIQTTANEAGHNLSKGGAVHVDAPVDPSR